MARPAKSFPSVDPSLTGSGYEGNQAVARCVKAWHRTYGLASIAPGDRRLAPEDQNGNYFAREQAAIAFRDAMPPLCGPENISDFIACVTFGMLKNVFSAAESMRLLEAAKTALSALRIAAAAAREQAD